MATMARPKGNDNLLTPAHANIFEKLFKMKMGIKGKYLSLTGSNN